MNIRKDDVTDYIDVKMDIKREALQTTLLNKTMMQMFPLTTSSRLGNGSPAFSTLSPITAIECGGYVYANWLLVEVTVTGFLKPECSNRFA